MPGAGPSGTEQVRAAEVVGALCLATDLAMGFPLEHGLHSTLFAARLSERLGVDTDTEQQAFYGCLLYYSGCTADAYSAVQIFGGNLNEHHTPAIFGSQRDNLLGIVRALPTPASPPPARALQVARRLPQAARAYRPHMTAMCEVARMLATGLAMPDRITRLFEHLTDRWDGNGPLGRAAREELPLALRIVQVARDAALHRMIGGTEQAVRVVRERAGAAFDPEVAAGLADGADEILALDPEAPAWDEALAREPRPRLTLAGEALDRALAAVGEFADFASPCFSGRSASVAVLAERAAARCGLDGEGVARVRRAGHVHDLGRVAVHPRIWLKRDPLTHDEWEQIRLHPYQSERVLLRSPALAALAPLAGAHHERLDGSGYHRGCAAADLPPGARVLAAADAYHAMVEPRAHRPPHAPGRAAELLAERCRAGEFDADAVTAVLDAAGQPVPRIDRPAGLTEREVEVVRLLARGLQTKQVARRLGVATKTADRHVQNAYAKIGVSTRAGATLFAMQHGLLTWGELPMDRPSEPS